MTVASDLMKKGYPKIDVKDTVSHWIGKMSKTHNHFAFVFDGRKFLGVVGKEWLRTSRIDPSKMKVGNLLKHRSKSKSPLFVPKLIPSTDIADICRLMDTSETYLLPVVQKESVIGAVDAWSVLQDLKELYRGIAVSRLVKRGVVVLHPTDEIGFAIKTMNRRNLSRMPVVDARNRLVGFVSLTDIIEGFHRPRRSVHIPNARSHQAGTKSGSDVGESYNLLQLPVKNVMTTSRKYCVKPSATVPQAIDSCCTHCVGSIVLCEDNEPVGIITVRDILRDASIRLRTI